MVKTQRLIFVVFATVALAVMVSPWSRSVEERTSLPWLFQLRGPISAPPNVQVIAIHLDATRRLGLPSQPVQWPRQVYADLITQLNTLGAKLIVLDIAFKTAQTDDAVLAKTLREADNVLLFQYMERETRQLPGLGKIDIQQPVLIPPQLAQAALGTANFTLPIASGPIVSTQLYKDFGRGLQAALPVLTYHKMGGIDLPVNTHPFYINFYGPPQTITTIALDQLLTGDVPALKGKIVFVGLAETIQTEQRDVHKTVFSQNHGLDISGVEVLATVFANIATHQNIKPSGLIIHLSLSLLVLAVVYMSYRYFSVVYSLSAQFALFILVITTSLIVFKQTYTWLPFFLPSLLGLLMYCALLASRYYENAQIKKASIVALQRYVPKRIVTQLAKAENDALNSNSVVEGVCLMTDLQGFSTLSERLPPEELHTLLNTYYSVLEQTISRLGGEVANIVGDSMLALWMGKNLTPSMCANALRAAEDLLVAQANNQFQDQVQALLQSTSIGIHAGPFSLGHLGAGQHYEYAPVGDTVNTAARIEKLNRKVATRLLISEPVMKVLGSSVKSDYRCVGTYALHNKRQTVLLYTPNSNPLKKVLRESSTEHTPCLDISEDALP